MDDQEERELERNAARDALNAQWAVVLESSQAGHAAMVAALRAERDALVERLADAERHSNGWLRLAARMEDRLVCVKDYGWWCRTHARDHAVCVAYETCAAICDGLRYKGTVKRPAHDPSVPVTIKAANQALRGAAERIRQRAGAPAEA